MSDREVGIVLFELFRSANVDVRVQRDGRFAWGRRGETWGLLSPSEALLQMLLDAAEVGVGAMLIEAAMLSDVADERPLAQAG